MSENQNTDEREERIRKAQTALMGKPAINGIPIEAKFMAYGLLIVSIIVAVGFFSLMGALALRGDQEMVKTIGGYLVGPFSMVLGFYFGQQYNRKNT